MVSKSLVFTGPQGLHARPAGKTSRKSERIWSNISIEYQGNHLMQKQLLSLSA